MKAKFKAASALVNADPDLVTAIGQAMIVFAAIEGLINFYLSFLIKNHLVWKQIKDGAIKRRLELYGQLIAESGCIARNDITQTIRQTQAIFEKRNLIAHNPIITGGGKSGARISRIGSKNQELSAEQVAEIARSADKLYNEIWQSFATYQFSHFEDKRGKTPDGGRAS